MTAATAPILTDRDRIRAFRDSDQSVPIAIKGSPFAAGLHCHIVRIDVPAETIRLTFAPGADYVAARDTIQGGAVATMLDFTMAFLALALLPDGRSTSTVNLNINYLKPVLPGDHVADGYVERIGRTTLFLGARLSRVGGDAVAAATGVFAVIDRTAAQARA